MMPPFVLDPVPASRLTQLPHRAFIGIGANLGSRQRNMEKALRYLHTLPQIAVLRVSQFLETEPVGGPPGQGKYFNGAAELATALSPHLLLQQMLDVEHQFGRDRSSRERNAPRTLDLDLLLYDDKILHETGLELPHQRMHERAFVLLPLAQIAGETIHPVLKKTIAQLARELPASTSADAQDQ